MTCGVGLLISHKQKLRAGASYWTAQEDAEILLNGRGLYNADFVPFCANCQNADLRNARVKSPMDLNVHERWKFQKNPLPIPVDAPTSFSAEIPCGCKTLEKLEGARPLTMLMWEPPPDVGTPPPENIELPKWAEQSILRCELHRIRCRFCIRCKNAMLKHRNQNALKTRAGSQHRKGR